MSDHKHVLLSGITGFIGMHTAIQLLNKGYKVRGTIRDLSRADIVRDVIKSHAPTEGLEIVKCELTNPTDWTSAAKGVDYVQHIASPLPSVQPKNRNDLIIPAWEGALNVLKAAKENNVRRVIMTSSVAAIGFGHKDNNRVFTEDDWTDPADKKDVPAYAESKTLAEKAAWAFAEKNQPFELVTINPSYVLGPLVDPDFSASVLLVKKILDGDMPGAPRMRVTIVDVRDVAAMHLMAMEKPEAAGKRFICSGSSVSILEISRILREHYPDQAKKAPRFEIPNFIVRLFALFDKQVAGVLNELDVRREFDHSRAHEILGWSPRSVEEAITAAAGSMIELGVVE